MPRPSKVALAPTIALALIGSLVGSVPAAAAPAEESPASESVEGELAPAGEGEEGEAAPTAETPQADDAQTLAEVPEDPLEPPPPTTESATRESGDWSEEGDGDFDGGDGDFDGDGEPVFDDYNTIRDSPEALTARRWLRSGIAATIVGGVLVGGAIAMSQTARCDPFAGNNCFTDARNRAALSLGAPGGLLLLGGVAMTTVGALQRKRLWTSLAFARGEVTLAVGGSF